MKNIFSSVLLPILMVVVFTSEVFAQSAKEAAKYGELQEIQVVKPGSLKKSIKKGDSNVKAIKVSGELNAQDWAIIYSLPNIAYLDLHDVMCKETVMEQKHLDKFISFPFYSDPSISSHELLLLCNNTLKYLVLPEGIQTVYFYGDRHYTLDMLCTSEHVYLMSTEDWLMVLRGGNGNPAAMTIHNIRTKSYADGSIDINQFLYDFLRCQDSPFNICDTLFITGNNNKVRTCFVPSVVIMEDTMEKTLIQYRDTNKFVDLSTFDHIGVGAFNNCNIEEINLGDKITHIPVGCFAGCKNLKKISMPRVTSIGEGAFANCNIEEINLGDKITHIPAGCFAGCKNLKMISMPKVTSIGVNAFEGTTITHNIQYKLHADSLEFHMLHLKGTGMTVVDLTNHPYAPILDTEGTEYDFREYVEENVEFIISAGTRKHRYNVGGWEKLRITELGTQDTYTFQLDSVGSLKNFLTEDIIPNVRSLTLKGFMDETEFALIRRCKYLKYLDMTDCFTFGSVEVAKQKYRSNAAFLQFLSAAAGINDEITQMKYNNHEATTEEALEASSTAAWFKAIVPDITDEDIDALFGNGKLIPRTECYFPEGAFDGLKYLEEIHFPKKLLCIERKHLFPISIYSNHTYTYYEDYIQRLKKVRVSNEVHTLGEKLFADSPLEDINFPDSLKYVGWSCFWKCNLQKVDLSNTNISAFAYRNTERYNDETKSIGLPLNAFQGNPLKELRLPNKLKSAEWMGDKFSRDVSPANNEIILYTYLQEPFLEAKQLEAIYGKIKELHIPRGTKAAWRGYSNLIDDL